MENLDEEIRLAIDKKIITQTNEYYHTNLSKTSITKRIDGNKNAEKALIKAYKKATFIKKHFPFVEGIAVSGSLSKGYFDNDSDVDYFIITKPNHLWTCRTILIFYKKLFLLNSRKYFCLNYFITSDNLEIQEKNIFTATEIATLLPIHGAVFETFFIKNNWYKTFLPNKNNNKVNEVTINPSWTATLLETIFQKRAGIQFEKFCYRLTYAIWRKKFRDKMNPEDFELAFKSSNKVSKHHPSNFQKKVIDILNLKYSELRQKHNIDIPEEHV